MKRVIFFILMMSCSTSFGVAKTVEFIAGATYTAFDDYSEYDEYGVSAKFRYHHFGFKDRGFFMTADFPAEPFFMANLLGGYGFRSGGPIFFEAGAGVFYGQIWGKGIAAIIGTGYISGKWYISLPITFKNGIALEITPLIGYSF